MANRRLYEACGGRSQQYDQLRVNYTARITEEMLQDELDFPAVDINNQEPIPRRHLREEPVRQRRISPSQQCDFLLPPIMTTDRRGSSSSWRSHSFRHTPSPPEDLCIRRSSSLKTGMIRSSRENIERPRALSNRELRRESLHGSLSRSRDRMPHGSREMYTARDSPQLGRPLNRRRASTMVTDLPPFSTNPTKAMIHRKSSLGNPCSSFTENWLTEALRLNALSQLQRKASDASSHASSHCLMMSRNSFDNGGSCPGLPLENSASMSTTPVRRLSSESMRGQPQLYFNYSQPLLDVPGYYDSGSLSSHRSSADFTSDDPSQYSAYLTASGYTSVTHSGRSSLTSTQTAQAESLRSSLSLANNLTAALHSITGGRGGPDGQELANAQLGPGQAHPDSFNVSAGSIKIALRVTKGKLEVQVLSMADLNLPTSSHVMYVKTCLIHDGQAVLQKKLKLGHHCSSKQKVKYAACDIDANTSLQVTLFAKLKKKRRRQYLGEVCLSLRMLDEESYTAGWYTLFKHAREPCPM
ncbi:uncharacterized protein [Amphiura filiformis]|uniref:uncharacterized protein n=1 Tax=Amphiura filiformis TaxID=82378 RepID=UPI003B219C6C